MNIKEKNREKIWLSKQDTSPEALESQDLIARKLRVDPIVAKLLYIRGYTNPSSAMSFLRMEDEIFINPFRMKDMEKAVARIRKAVESKEKITIYGDYDVDGVTSVCTLYLYLQSKGANVDYYIPNRSGEGYGVSCSAIDAIKENGTTLIITVDTGVTATEEVLYAKSIGVDFVVTDHHECRSDLPLAEAVINPHRPDCEYPFKELAGVGVVFKLLCAYEESTYGVNRRTATYNVIKEYADLVCIGTIADVMPIKEENRIIVKYGLGMIDTTDRPGLLALIDAASGRDARRNDRSMKRKKKAKITSSFIGFTLAPRINAAGRVRSATVAVELFLSDNYDDAMEIATELCNANKERQAEENTIMLEAYKKIDALDIDRYPVIVLDANDWHHGVIGIVSSRITEKYSRPSILVSFEGNEGIPSNEDIGKGSGRSIKGLNMVDALCHCSDLLVKFGGHELAAGLSVTRENLPLFREKINEYAREQLTDSDMVHVIEADMEIPFSSISLALAESISQLEPFGVGNPVPLFIVKGVHLFELSGISDGKHSKMVLGDGEKTISAMCFSNSPDSLGVYVGDKVDCLFSLDINEWQDRRNVQLVVRDIKASESQLNAHGKEVDRFIEIKNGDPIRAEEDVIPSREDFVLTYRFIQNALHQGQDTFSHRDLVSKLSHGHTAKGINYVKLKFIFMIFTEMNIVSIEEIESDVYKFNLHFSSSKKDLEKSGILKKLRSQLRV
ncbi:MAG: single-stranded-DNA-specific exonuclease RecJ [Clostridia bacterium]|nr:single-stranded-DNA-specific exonuclease RecJ [Clostridia bacterium]